MKTLKISGFLKPFGKENDENLQNLWIQKSFLKKTKKGLGKESEEEEACRENSGEVLRRN